MRAIVFALFGACLLAGSASAQTAGENGRYSMTPSQGGFLRLDTRTGEVAMCRPAGESVECRAAAQERSALNSEIDRLAKENAELKARLAGQPPATAVTPPSRGREEMDRALDYAERFMRRMMRIMRDDTPPDRT
ncbi:MAG: hypothetical protein JWN07_879 [Hyphomicrobiales bacterium]|nr:hypothetical protein [Hyphomicrobiales bacterium]